MKLLRYGAPGRENPGLPDQDGRIRDLSGHLSDIDGDALRPCSLARLGALDPATLPLAEGAPRLGCPVARIGKPAPVYLKPGDVMTLGIERLGRQRQLVRSWSRA